MCTTARLLSKLGNSRARKREKHLLPTAPHSEDSDTGWKHREGTCLPGTAPRCRRMDPVLLGRTVRFHPCLFEGWHRGRHSQRTFPTPTLPVPSCPAGLCSGVRQQRGWIWGSYLENGSDFPTGKPLPWVLVSTFPQCTATWQSFCSTIRQYSCCGKRKQ